MFQNRRRKDFNLRAKHLFPTQRVPGNGWCIDARTDGGVTEFHKARGVSTKPNWKGRGIFTELTKSYPRIIHTRMAVRLKNRYQSAIGGFQFVDAAISTDPIVDWGFNTLVDQIIARRMANPRFDLTTNRGAVEAEADLQNALRMRSILGGDMFIVDDGGGGQQNFSAPRSARRSVVAKVRAVASGKEVLLDWLGEGGIAVEPELSESRARICAACPQNKAGDWLAFFTQPIAEKIREALAAKNERALTTSQDAKLNVCEACLCPIPLKVHSPIKHIQEHLTDEVKNRLDSKCWIRSELASVK